MYINILWKCGRLRENVKVISTVIFRSQGRGFALAETLGAHLRLAALSNTKLTCITIVCNSSFHLSYQWTLVTLTKDAGWAEYWLLAELTMGSATWLSLCLAYSHDCRCGTVLLPFNGNWVHRSFSATLQSMTQHIDVVLVLHRTLTKVRYICNIHSLPLPTLCQMV